MKQNLLLTALLTSFLFISCEKERIGSRQLDETVSEIKQWYNVNSVTSVSKSDLSSLIPIWDTAYEHENKKHRIVEFALENPKKISIEAALNSDHFNINIVKLVILTDKKTGEKLARYMFIVGNSDATTQIHYMNLGKFTGKTYFIDMDGKFLVGWGYAEGKIIKKLTPVHTDDNHNAFGAKQMSRKEIEHKSFLVNIECSVKEVPTWGTNCVESGPVTIGEEPGNEFDYGNCNTYITGYQEVVECVITYPEGIDPDGNGGGGGGNGGSGNGDNSPLSPDELSQLEELKEKYRDQMSSAELAIFDTLSLRQQWNYLMSAHTAASWAKEHYSSTTTDGQGDAYRHTFWNAMSTAWLGENLTENLTTAHEKPFENNNNAEIMDLHNNGIGRQIGRNNANQIRNNPTALHHLVVAALNGGALKFIVNDILVTN